MKYILYLLLSIISLSIHANELTRFIVLDVKEGQSIAIQRGHKAMLVDSGHLGEVASVLKRLEAYGIDTVQSLVLTHLHPDHASGYFRLAESFKRMSIYHNCQPLADKNLTDVMRWTRDALTGNQQSSCVRAGDELNFEGIPISFLWPLKFENNNPNYHSLVLVAELGEHKALIMGDAGFAAEQHLLESRQLDKEFKLLVAGHHGASDASSESFIAKLKPDYAIISVNASNIRGYPSESVVERLQQHSRKLLRTDRQGDIVFELAGQKLIYQGD